MRTTSPRSAPLPSSFFSLPLLSSVPPSILLRHSISFLHEFSFLSTPNEHSWDIFTMFQYHSPPLLFIHHRWSYPDDTTKQAVRIVATQRSDDGPLDLSETTREALAWCALHARAATVAEEELAVELVARDVQVLLSNNRFFLRSELCYRSFDGLGRLDAIWDSGIAKSIVFLHPLDLMACLNSLLLLSHKNISSIYVDVTTISKSSTSASGVKKKVSSDSAQLMFDLRTVV